MERKDALIEGLNAEVKSLAGQVDKLDDPRFLGMGRKFLAFAGSTIAYLVLCWMFKDTIDPEAALEYYVYLAVGYKLTQAATDRVGRGKGGGGFSLALLRS